MRVLRRSVQGWWRIGALRAALAIATILSLGGGAVGLVTSAAAGQLGTHRVPGVLPGLARATDLGAAPLGKRLEVGVGITQPDQAAQDKLFSELYNPKSSQYHHFLTVAEFRQRFGVRPGTTAAVRSWLTHAGLHIATSSAGGDYFTATGTVAQLEHLFKVRIGEYAYRSMHFLANDAAPSVPDGLPITAVAGLNTLSVYRPDSLHGRQLARASNVGAAIAAGRRIISHNDTLGPQAGPQSGDEQTYTPQDLWGIYDDPGASSLTESSGISNPSTIKSARTTLGQGQKIGVFGEGETSSVVRQLRLFETAMGLPKVPVRTIETEGSPDSAYGDNSGAIEWYLDSQSSTGMAPDVRQLDFYFAKSLSDADVAKEFDYWANDPNGPREMNASFGECEQNPSEPVTGPLSTLPAGVAIGGDAEALSDPALRQAALEGRTLFTSAGDTGSGCPEVVAPIIGAGNGVAIQPVPAQSYPCVSDYAVCVGGTVVSSPGTSYPNSAKRTAETSWQFSGGGTSYFNPAPSYQQNVAAVDHDCVSNDTGSTVYAPGSAPKCRGVPDVADLSGNITGDGYFIYIDGEPASEGGTSLSSPLMMGQWARVQAAASSTVQNDGGLGFADGTIYNQARGADTCASAPCSNATYRRDFFDITQSEYGTGNGVYRPTGGWDYASGWGALNVANFTQDVDGKTNATDAYSGQERPAAVVCKATMTSPTGNATDPVTGESNDSGIDLTQATLTTSGSKVTATLTVPDLSSNPPAESTNGASYYVAWEYDGIVYYGVANEPEGGGATTAGWTFDYGNTGPAMTAGAPNYGSYDNTGTATGSVNLTSGVITITVPSRGVGSPGSGALLTDPQAFVQIELGVPEVASATAITVDSADTLRNYSADDGELDSIGADVRMDGVSGSTCSNTLPVTSVPRSTKPKTGTTSTKLGGRPVVCSEVHRFVTHIRTKKITRSGVRLTGVAYAHCPDYITHDSIAIARVHGRRCSFLRANHHWTAYGSCRPRDYLKARGTEHWTFRIKVNLSHGVFFLWEHAVNNRRQATRNTARKHVYARFT